MKTTIAFLLLLCACSNPTATNSPQQSGTVLGTWRRPDYGTTLEISRTTATYTTNIDRKMSYPAGSMSIGRGDSSFTGRFGAITDFYYTDDDFFLSLRNDSLVGKEDYRQKDAFGQPGPWQYRNVYFIRN